MVNNRILYQNLSPTFRTFCHQKQLRLSILYEGRWEPMPHTRQLYVEPYYEELPGRLEDSSHRLTKVTHSIEFAPFTKYGPGHY